MVYYVSAVAVIIWFIVVVIIFELSNVSFLLSVFITSCIISVICCTALDVCWLDSKFFGLSLLCLFWLLLFSLLLALLWGFTEADPEYILNVEWRSRDSWRNWILFMKYENMKEVSHGFCKKYKVLQNLVCVMVTVNISSNLRRVVRSAVTSEFKAVLQYGSSVI